MYYQVAAAFGEFNLSIYSLRWKDTASFRADVWSQGSTTEPIKTTPTNLKRFLQCFMDTMWIISSPCFQPYLFVFQNVYTFNSIVGYLDADVFWVFIPPFFREIWLAWSRLTSLGLFICAFFWDVFGAHILSSLGIVTSSSSSSSSAHVSRPVT